MNNEDFRALVRERTRFDLKQVEQWDRELKRKEKKAEKFAQKRKQQQEQQQQQRSKQEGLGGAYRDRAEERRKGQNPDYGEELAAAQRLDAEQSKFLGGDERYTHLVRGLDHALLAKVKRELQEAKKAAQEEQRRAVEYTPATAIGKAIKALLHNPQQVKPAAPVDFSRMAFEFDLSPNGAEVPLIFQRSRIESSPEDTLVMFTVPQRMLERVANVMELKVYLPKGKKRRKKTDGRDEGDDTAAPQQQQQEQQQQPKQPLITSIFDDDVGVYVPPGALELEQKKQQLSQQTAATQANSGLARGPAAAGGYFSDLKAVKPSEQERESEDESRRQFLPQHTSEEDLTDEQKKQLKKSLLPYLQSSKRAQPSTKAGPSPAAPSAAAGSSAAIRVPGEEEEEDYEDEELEAIRRQLEERKRTAAGGSKFADYDGIYPDTAELGFTYESDEEEGPKKRKKGAGGSAASEPPKSTSMAPDDF